MARTPIIITKQTAAKEDFDFGDGSHTRTFPIQELDDLTLTKINAGHWPVEDSSSVFTGTEVEDVLKELYDSKELLNLDSEFSDLKDNRVEFLFGSTTAPANTSQPWFDTNVNRWKRYDTGTASWVDFTADVTGTYERVIGAGEWSGGGPVTISLTHDLMETDVLVFFQVDAATAFENLAFDRATATDSTCIAQRASAAAGTIIVIGGLVTGISDESITTAKFASGSVTNPKLENGSGLSANEFYGTDGAGLTGGQDISDLYFALENNTTNTGLTASDLDGSNGFSNVGASQAITYSLPAAAEDLKGEFVVTEDFAIKLAADGSDIIRIGLETFSEFTLGSKGDSLVIYGTEPGVWIADIVETTVGDLGIIAGGGSGTVEIDRVTISSAADASDHGVDLTEAQSSFQGGSNGISGRAMFLSGSGTVGTGKWQAITIKNNASSELAGFQSSGSLQDHVAATNNVNDRIVTGHGGVMEFKTISSDSNSTEVGDFLYDHTTGAGTSNGVSDRGIYLGGSDGGADANISHNTISSAANTVDNGDMSSVCQNMSATSNLTGDKAVVHLGDDGGGAGNYRDTVDVKVISTSANATNHATLTSDRGATTGLSNGLTNRGMFCGGQDTGGSDVNNLDFFNIEDGGSSADFGDLTSSKRRCASASNA